MKNIIQETIDNAIDELPKLLTEKLTDDDKLLLSEFAYSLYLDGWNNAKVLLEKPLKQQIAVLEDRILDLKDEVEILEDKTYI